MQGLRCRIQGHIPGERIIRNAGRRFGRCSRCGVDLLEMHGKWVTPPKGARIVWASPEGRGPGDPGGDDADRAEPVEPGERADSDRREGRERRKLKGPLPSFLRGQERRSGQRDRRTAFGRRFRG